MLAGGLGVGTLILCVLFALAFFLAFIGFQINRPVLMSLAGFGLFLLVLIIFAAIPKKDAVVSTAEYDKLYNWRVAVTVILSLFALLGLILVLVERGLMQVKATRVTNSILLR